MLHIDIICVGKLKETYLKDAIAEYSKRLSKYCILNIIELQDEKIPEKINDKIAEDIKKKECYKILNSIKKDTYTIALDLGGKQFSSEDFSIKIKNICNFNSSITFIIGGSLGLTKDLLSKVNEKICFSLMTFPHQLIRLFLVEQIFRSFKIINNETYHR